jgi:hypothetical protein
MNAEKTIAVILISAWTASAFGIQLLGSLERGSDKLMSEEHRQAVKKIVVLPASSPAGGAITGSYQKETDGLIDGIDKGRAQGTISKEVSGIPINIPIPILQFPLAVFGGMSGGIKRQIQDFRDALTKDLAESANSPLSNDALATDVFWRLRESPQVDPKVFALTTPIPEDTDAVLYVTFSESAINVEGKEATLTFSATATLRRVSDGKDLYENRIHYRDTDLLEDWTKNDKAAWRDYSNFARHYVGREIAAQLYERVEVEQELRPEESENVSRIKKNEWLGVTKSTTPTLAWDYHLGSGETQAKWAAAVNPADIVYEVEIYDMHRLVYVAKGVEESEHTVDMPLEACGNYRWSVRPSFLIDGKVRFGEWMRSDPDAANGNSGKAASVAAAYIYDFASLEIKCGH